jgi:hypothetical protein
VVSQKLKSLRGIMVRNSGFSKTSFFVVCDDIWIAIYPPVVVVKVFFIFKKKLSDLVTI